jgi:hypothetical protein
MVTLLGLFQPFKVLFQVLFLGKRNAINAGKLLLGLVTAPVGTCHVHDLDGLDDARVRDMTATAQIGKIAVVAEGYLSVRQVLNQLNFELVASILIKLQRIGLAHRLHLELGLLSGEFKELLFDGREIGVRNGAACTKVHIIIEPTLDGWVRSSV